MICRNEVVLKNGAKWPAGVFSVLHVELYVSPKIPLRKPYVYLSGLSSQVHTPRAVEEGIHSRSDIPFRAAVTVGLWLKVTYARKKSLIRMPTDPDFVFFWLNRGVYSQHTRM